MSTFGWLSLAIVGLAFLVPIHLLVRAKLAGEPVALRDLLKPPWKWEGWTWTLPEQGDPFHDTKLILLLGGIMVGLTTLTAVFLVLGTLAMTHHVRWVGYPLLGLTLLGCLAMIAFAGFRLWVDFGRPAKRWLRYRRHS